MIYPAIPCLLTSNEKRCLEVSPLGGSDLTRSSQQRRQTGIMMIFSLRCGRLNKLVRGCQPESPISTPTYTVALVPGSLDKLSFFFFFCYLEREMLAYSFYLYFLGCLQVGTSLDFLQTIYLHPFSFKSPCPVFAHFFCWLYATRNSPTMRHVGSPGIFLPFNFVMVTQDWEIFIFLYLLIFSSVAIPINFKFSSLPGTNKCLFLFSFTRTSFSTFNSFVYLEIVVSFLQANPKVHESACVGRPDAWPVPAQLVPSWALTGRSLGAPGQAPAGSTPRIYTSAGTTKIMLAFSPRVLYGH